MWPEVEFSLETFLGTSAVPLPLPFTPIDQAQPGAQAGERAEPPTELGTQPTACCGIGWPLEVRWPSPSPEGGNTSPT